MILARSAAWASCGVVVLAAGCGAGGGTGGSGGGDWGEKPLVTGATSSASSGTGGATSSSSSTASSSSGGGEGGAGGGDCVPNSDPCGSALCGEVDDGCGHTVVCGKCYTNQLCTEAGKCCTPKLECDPTHCGTEPDGCGGEIACDPTCGWNPWLHCDGTGTCACADAVGYPNSDVADKLCNNSSIPRTPWYCGVDDNDPHIVGYCHHTALGGFVPVPSGTLLWCCQAPAP